MQYILYVSNDRIAMVLNKINSIDGFLIDDEEKYTRNEIKIVCRIKLSKTEEFLNWLSRNNITCQKFD